MAVAVGIEAGMAVDIEENMAVVVHSAVGIEEGTVVAVGIEEGMAVVHIAVGIGMVFVVDIESEVAMGVRPAVEAVMDIQEDSSADIALEAASIVGLTMNIGVDIQD